MLLLPSRVAFICIHLVLSDFRIILSSISVSPAEFKGKLETNSRAVIKRVVQDVYPDSFLSRVKKN